MLRNKRGSTILLLSWTLISGLLVVTESMLTRSVAELMAANRSVAKQQAFQSADAGLDYATNQLRQMTEPQLLALLPGPTELTEDANQDGRNDEDGMPYRVTIEDNDDGDGNPAQDVDGVFTVTSEGVATAMSMPRQRIIAMVSVRQPIFRYGVIAEALTLKDRVTLGEASHLAPLFLTQALTTQATTGVWADTIKFHSPTPSCPDCLPTINASIFHGAPQVLVNQPTPATTVQVDLHPYYNQAKAEYADPALQCANGVNYHYITGAQGSTVTIDGADCPGGITGMIYVEKGVNVTLKGDLTINGTLVHEGLSDTRTGMPVDGHISFTPGANVTIDSRSGSAPGVALLSWAGFDAPATSPPITLHANGYLMYDGMYAVMQPGPASTIEGGIFDLCSYHVHCYAGPMISSGAGPGAGVLTLLIGVHGFSLGGDLTLLYEPPPGTPLGFNLMTLQPKVLLWQNE